MIRHSRALKQLASGTLIYNTGSFTPDAPKTYFIKGKNGRFQPCDKDGKVYLLEYVEEGFESDQIYLPAFVVRPKE